MKMRRGHLQKTQCAGIGYIKRTTEHRRANRSSAGTERLKQLNLMKRSHRFFGGFFHE